MDFINLISDDEDVEDVEDVQTSRCHPVAYDDNLALPLVLSALDCTDTLARDLTDRRAKAPARINTLIDALRHVVSSHKAPFDLAVLPKRSAGKLATAVTPLPLLSHSVLYARLLAQHPRLPTGHAVIASQCGVSILASVAAAHDPDHCIRDKNSVVLAGGCAVGHAASGKRPSTASVTSECIRLAVGEVASGARFSATVLPPSHQAGYQSRLDQENDGFFLLNGGVLALEALSMEYALGRSSGGSGRFLDPRTRLLSLFELVIARLPDEVRAGRRGRLPTRCLHAPSSVRHS